MTYDLVVRGGTVVDGTRLPRLRADVGITDGKVAKIGRIGPGQGAKELDATGLIVAPGFVDLHTHYDAQIHWDPYCTVSGWHGVTSLVLGNCGFGFAPVKPQDRDRALLMMTRTEQIPFQTMKAGMRWAWETFPEWLDNLQRIPKGVNCVSYVPVSPLMVYVMGLEAAKTRLATATERREMQRLLHEAMDAGACGFSVQRLGANSLQADHDGTPMPTDCMADEDVLSLADVLHERDEGFIQITQSQVGNPETASAEENARDIQFLETLAERAGRPVLHNVILALDAYPGAYRNSLQWLHDCNARGLRIYGQGFTGRIWFEYTFEDWNLYDFRAPWNDATQGTHDEKLAKLSDPAIRQAMKDDYPNFMKPEDRSGGRPRGGPRLSRERVAPGPEGGGLPLDPRQRRGDLRGRRGHRRDAGTTAAQRRERLAPPAAGATPCRRPCRSIASIRTRDATRASPTTPASRHTGVRIRLYWHGSTWDDGEDWPCEVGSLRYR